MRGIYESSTVQSTAQMRRSQGTSRSQGTNNGPNSPGRTKRAADTDRGGGSVRASQTTQYLAQDPNSLHEAKPQDVGDPAEEPQPKRLKSPPSSLLVQRDDPELTSSGPNRSRSRQGSSDLPPEYAPRAPRGRQLWSEGDAPLPKGAVDRRNIAMPTRPRTISRKDKVQQRPSTASEETGDLPEDPRAHEVIRQPETRPISQEQLVAEVRASMQAWSWWRPSA